MSFHIDKHLISLPKHTTNWKFSLPQKHSQQQYKTLLISESNIIICSTSITISNGPQFCAISFNNNNL